MTSDRPYRTHRAGTNKSACAGRDHDKDDFEPFQVTALNEVTRETRSTRVVSCAYIAACAQSDHAARPEDRLAKPAHTEEEQQDAGPRAARRERNAPATPARRPA